MSLPILKATGYVRTMVNIEYKKATEIYNFQPVMFRMVE